MNIKSLDLNLLLVFDAVMRERHVTKAAQSLFMTQPALSNALNRLRHVFKDDLFVRGPKGMRPTSKAEELALPIRQALQTIDDAINPAIFDPLTSRHEFKIICNDLFVQVILPELMRRLSTSAPHVNVRLYPAQGNSYEMLDAHKIDFGISAYGQPPDRFDHVKLLSDEYAVLMGEHHPLASLPALDLATFSSAAHLLVSLSGDPRGFVDKSLELQGFKRRVALTVNQFSSAPAILCNSPLILTLPRALAERYAKDHPLCVRDCPIKAPTAYTDTLLIWHKRLSEHPANEWLRQLIVSIDI